MGKKIDCSSLDGKEILICTRNEYQHLFYAKELLCGELHFGGRIDIDDFFSSIKEVYVNTPPLWLKLSKPLHRLYTPSLLYWRVDFSFLDNFTRLFEYKYPITQKNIEALRESYISRTIDPCSDCLIQIEVHRFLDKDLVFILGHHSILDGSRLIEFVLKVFMTYNGIELPPGNDSILPFMERTPGRFSFLQVLKHILKFFKTCFKTSFLRGRIVDTGTAGAPSYAQGIKSLNMDLAKLKDVVASYEDITLNDVILAASHAAVSSWNSMHGARETHSVIGVPKKIPAIKEGDNEALFSVVRLISNFSDAHKVDMHDLLQDISNDMSNKKMQEYLATLDESHKSWIGSSLNSIPACLVRYMTFIPPVSLLISNMGDFSKISLRDVPLEMTLVFGGAVHSNIVGISNMHRLDPIIFVSTYDNRVTLTIRYHKKQFTDHTALLFLNLIEENILQLLSVPRGGDSIHPLKK